MVKSLFIIVYGIIKTHTATLAPNVGLYMTIVTMATHTMIPQVCKHCQHIQHKPPVSTPANNDSPTHDISPVTEKNISGSVKWYNVLKGFGFITRTDTSQDIFVHRGSIVKPNPAHKKVSLGQNEQVMFDIVHVNGRSSPEAINVTGLCNTNVSGRKRNFVDSSATPSCMPVVMTTCTRSVNATAVTDSTHHAHRHRRSVRNQDSKPATRPLRRLLPSIPVQSSKACHPELSHVAEPELQQHSHHIAPTRLPAS